MGSGCAAAAPRPVQLRLLAVEGCSNRRSVRIGRQGYARALRALPNRGLRGMIFSSEIATVNSRASDIRDHG
jgi:hypothetical protein